MDVKKMTMQELEEMSETLNNLILREGCFGRSDMRDLLRVSAEIKQRQEDEANERART